MSVFLAQFLGLFFLVSGLFILTKGQQIQKALAELKSSPLILILSGILRFLFGLFIVLSHPEWQKNWNTLITIIGYLFIISGIIRLFFPAAFFKLLPKVKIPTLSITGIIVLIVGLLLTYQGFFIRF